MALRFCVSNISFSALQAALAEEVFMSGTHSVALKSNTVQMSVVMFVWVEVGRDGCGGRGGVCGRLIGQ